jgi:hypothetical protein
VTRVQIPDGAFFLLAESHAGYVNSLKRSFLKLQNIVFYRVLGRCGMTGEGYRYVTYWRIASMVMAAPHSVSAACEAVTMTDIAMMNNLLGPREIYNTYRAGMPDEDLEEKLSKADGPEKIIAYGCGSVPERVAEKRMTKASQLEKGLIYMYCKGAYAKHTRKIREEKTECTENQAWMISDLPGM